MFAKRLLQKAVHYSQSGNVLLSEYALQNLQQGSLTPSDLDLRVAVHFGIPSTASILSYDPIQRLLAVGTLDGRIKVIGGDGIEGLLLSPKQLPYKNIEFLRNQGYLVSILNDNDIQVWNLESRCLGCCLQWEANITAFAVIQGSNLMYVGDEYGIISVMKYNVEDGKLVQLPYQISANSISEAAECPIPSDQPIVGVLPQPLSSGNRVLIAYQNGLVVLWDVFEARIVFGGGGKDLQLKDEVLEPSNELKKNSHEETLENHLGEKEISALCWASSNGSVLAVGYIDGDILFWNTSSASSDKGQQAFSSSNHVVKLQLSSAERRLPIIVLQWSPTHKTRNDYDGQLFIYGGDEIGAEEVLTVLTLEWSSGMETLRCIGRADLTLTGSFADMILFPSAGATRTNLKADVFVLTNPGQLHFYDDKSLSAMISQQQQEKKPFFAAMEFPAVIPTTDPAMTIAKLIKLPTGENSSQILSELTSGMKLGSMPIAAGGAKCPLTGGVPSQLTTSKDHRIKQVYLAGYADGSVRIWDATYPALSFINLFKGEVQGIKVAGSSAPISELNFCFYTLSLALGNECGLVHIYNLKGCQDGTNFHFVTETKNEVHNLSQQKGPQCTAVFSLINSPVQTLKFVPPGVKLAVGFKCGRVAVVDMNSLSVVFFIDDVSLSKSPVISISWQITNTHGLLKSPKQSEANILANSAEEVLFILTKDSNINVIDGHTGKFICSRPWNMKKESFAISMYVIEGNVSASKLCNEKQSKESFKDNAAKNEPVPDSSRVGINSHEMEHDSFPETASSGENLLDSFVLLCCEDSVRLYSTKSVIQGNDKPIHKVKHEKPCCWTTTFKKDGKLEGLVLLFQNGALEIRSIPDLELIEESSLMSILRWNFKTNMNKTMSSCDNGQITLANGCEVAFISLLAGENDLRIPDSLPCLHDKVLAAAADAALNFSLNQKKKQGTAPGIIGGIVKGLKGGKIVHTADLPTTQSTYNHLEEIFLKSSQSDASPSVDHRAVVELDIDDIEIDEPFPVASTSSHDIKNLNKEKGTEKERLLHGGTDDVKPRLRTPQEILAAYRKAGDASAVASQAKNKLMERQEKLERINRRTEELQNGAEDFASLANELVKTLENRKWWQI